MNNEEQLGRKDARIPEVRRGQKRNCRRRRVMFSNDTVEQWLSQYVVSFFIWHTLNPTSCLQIVFISLDVCKSLSNWMLRFHGKCSIQTPTNSGMKRLTTNLWLSLMLGESATFLECVFQLKYMQQKNIRGLYMFNLRWNNLKSKQWNYSSRGNFNTLVTKLQVS